VRELGQVTSESETLCGIEVKSFVYKGFADAENLADLVDRIAIYMAENRNTKLKVIRHNSRRHIG